ncbi:hypothetical protein KCU64_g1563, partial [Aureobasidium melanogenum]
MATMQSAGSEPYITAVLTGAQTELDLSGNNPFSLTISLTLHAKAPIICYIGEDNTFFLPQLALHAVGIIFQDVQTEQQISSSHLDICRVTDFQSGPARPLNEHTRLYMHPGKPVIFDIPFSSPRKKQGIGGFDLHFSMVTQGFRTGHTYHASLPTDRKISWWRWANFWEAEEQRQEDFVIMAALRSGIRSAVDWWTDREERKQGVSVLPENEQLPIHVQGNGVVFPCVGKSMEWPIRSEEEER